MGKQYLVYPYIRILFGHKKKRSADTCYNMHKPWKYYAKKKKPDTKGDIFYDLVHMNYAE